MQWPTYRDVGFSGVWSPRGHHDAVPSLFLLSCLLLLLEQNLTALISPLFLWRHDGVWSDTAFRAEASRHTLCYLPVPNETNLNTKQHSDLCLSASGARKKAVWLLNCCNKSIEVPLLTGTAKL